MREFAAWRRSGPAIAALATISLVSAAITVALVGGDSASPRQTVNADAFQGRVEPAVTPVGDDLFVFGGRITQGAGRRSFALSTEGALLSSDGSAQLLSSAPFGAPLDIPVAVSVADSTVVVVGISCDLANQRIVQDQDCSPGTYDAAVYEIATNGWTSVKVPAEIQKEVDAFSRASAQHRAARQYSRSALIL